MGERKARTTCRDSKPSSDTIEKLLKRTSLSDTTMPEPYFVRTSDNVLTDLRNLPQQGILVLFTPAVSPESPPSPSSQRMDPFEPLGRALSKYHKRIRHVPYVPTVGLTETHLAFLAHPAAMVVVVCTSKSEPNFAHAVIDEASLEADVPAVLVVVHDDSSKDYDWTEMEEVGVVVQTRSYSSAALKKVADMVFRDSS